jgi:hypothetical protein
VIEGVHIWNVYEHAGTDPHDYSHTNDISILNGNITNLTIADSYLTGNRGNHQAVTGDITGLDYDNVWWTGAEGTAFQFASYNGYHVFGSRTNVRSFDQAGRNPNDRLDLVNGQQLTGANSMPSLVDVIDTGVSLQAPPAGTPDPATVWRQNHPYSSWTQFFGWS